MSAANVLWLPLGELLVERRLLTQYQLERALDEQGRTGMRLGEVLVSMGYVSEATLAQMLLEQVGLTAPIEVKAAADAPSPEPEVITVSFDEEAEPETEAPVRASGPGEGDSREPGGSPAPSASDDTDPEPLVALAPEPEEKREPTIVRLDGPGRERNRWWSRNGNKARLRELEKVLGDFEQRSRAIEEDITRVRATLRSMREARSSD